MTRSLPSLRSSELQMIGIGAVMDIFAPEHLGGLVAAAAVLRSAHGAVDLHVAVLDGVQPGHLGGNDIDRQHQCRHLVGRMRPGRSEEQPSELQSLMRTSYAVFCLKKKKKNT